MKLFTLIHANALKTNLTKQIAKKEFDFFLKTLQIVEHANQTDFCIKISFLFPSTCVAFSSDFYSKFFFLLFFPSFQQQKMSNKREVCCLCLAFGIFKIFMEWKKREQNQLFGSLQNSFKAIFCRLWARIDGWNLISWKKRNLIKAMKNAEKWLLSRCN